MNTIKNPACRPGFEVVRGCDQNPHETLESSLHNYQQNYDLVKLLADQIDRQLLLRSELALLRAENARLKLIVGVGV